MQIRFPPSPYPHGPPETHKPHETRHRSCHFTPVLCEREVPPRSCRPSSTAKQHGTTSYIYISIDIV